MIVERREPGRGRCFGGKLTSDLQLLVGGDGALEKAILIEN